MLRRSRASFFLNIKLIEGRSQLVHLHIDNSSHSDITLEISILEPAFLFQAFPVMTCLIILQARKETLLNMKKFSP